MTYDEQQHSVPPTPRRTGPDAAGAPTAKAKGGKSKKIANSLVALGSAAIISVYGLGYARTQSAEESLTTDNPTIAIATTAPTTSAASAQIATFPSPLFAPSATAVAPSATATSAQSSATTAGASSTATSAPAATTAPTTVAKAPATTAATKAPATATTTAAKTAAYKDGTYSGIGTSRHGSITASVVVQGGKIVSAGITQCGTRYPCSQIASLPGEVVATQSTPVDFVSGATDSSQAYMGAIKYALAKAAA
jgi:uncharacterized protein with FMN-binding domain